MRCNRFTATTTRRDMLTGKCLRVWLLGAGSASRPEHDGRHSGRSTRWHPRPLIMPARARRVIFLFMWGGPSHVDLFDPKPKLNSESGKQLLGKSVGSDREKLGELLGSPFRFDQHGESGIWISELFPHLSKHADRMCVDPLHAHRGQRARRGVVAAAHRPGQSRPSERGCLGQLRLGLRERESARLHHDLSAARPWRSTELWKRIPSCRAPGDRDRVGRDTDFRGRRFQSCQQTNRHWPPAEAAPTHPIGQSAGI